jgi:hypothetical protein
MNKLSNYIDKLGIGDWAQSPIPNPQSPIPKLFKNDYLFLLSTFNLN